MAAGKYSFIIEQGATFERQVIYTDSAGARVNLTGYSARMQIRPTADSNVLYLSISSTVGADGSGLVITPVSGTVDITISALSSSYLTFSEAVYDLELYSGSGATEYVTRLLEGNVKLKKNVTR